MPTSSGSEPPAIEPLTSLTEQAAGSFWWEALAKGGQQLTQFLSTAVLARLLAPAVYGLLGMASMFVNFANTFGQFGIPGAIVQRPELDDEMASSLFWYNMAIGLFLTLLLILCAPLAAAFFHEPSVGPVLAAMAWTFTISALGNIQHALFYRSMKLRRPTIAGIVSSVSGLVVAVVMAVRGAGVWSLVGSLLVSRAVDSLLMWAMHPFRPAPIMRWSHFRAVANFGLNLSGFGIVNYFARNGDNLIIGRSLGSAPLGYYQNAYSLMFYPQQLVTSTVSNVLLSPLARVQDDIERFRAGALRIATSMAVVIFPMMCGMIVTADLVVAVALGPKWGAAAPLLAVLSVAGLVQASVAAVGPVLIAKGRTGTLLRLGVYSACVYFGCFLIGSHWGTMGVATACVAGSLLQFVALKVFLRVAQLSMWAYWRALLPVLFAGLGMAAVVGLWRLGMNALHITSVPILTVSSVMLGAASYLGLAMLLCRNAVEDLVNVLGKGFRKGPKPG